MENNIGTISNLQIILTVGVAIAAFISPVAVAFMNNRNSRLIRKSELEHEEIMKKIECEHSLSVERTSSILSLKSQVFMDLIDRLAKYYESSLNDTYKADLLSSLYKAAMYCEDGRIRNNVFSMIYNIKSGFSDKSDDSLERFKTSMESLVYALHFEISGSIPDEYTRG